MAPSRDPSTHSPCDSPAAGPLRLHESDGLLGTQEGAGQIDVDDGLPLVVAQLLHRYGRRPGAGIVEQQIEPAEALFGLCEQGADRRRIGHIGGDGKHPAAGGNTSRHCLVERLGPAAGEDDRIARRLKGQRNGPPDTASGAGHQCDLFT